MNREVIMAIVRMLVFVITGLNAVLVAKGISPIPIDETAVMEVVSYILAGGAAIWNWWKNNNITQAAQEAEKQLKAMKRAESGIE